MKKRPLDTVVNRRGKMENQKFFKIQPKRQIGIRKSMGIRIKKKVQFLKATIVNSFVAAHRSF